MNCLRRTSITLVALAAAACGGTKQGGQSGRAPGTGHVSGTGDDVDTPLETGVEGPDGGVAAMNDAGPAAPVTFVLNNTAAEELVLNMDKGWQPILFAYSGQPPNAKSILMFPTHCTASCDAAPEERCPECLEPERVKDIKESQTLERIPPGAAKEVPWDGMHFKYTRTKGVRGRRNVRCKCFTTEPAPPETYTVKACGLRLTKTAEASSKYECVESSMTLPAEEPIRVELDFGG